MLVAKALRVASNEVRTLSFDDSVVGEGFSRRRARLPTHETFDKRCHVECISVLAPSRAPDAIGSTERGDRVSCCRTNINRHAKTLRVPLKRSI